MGSLTLEIKRFLQNKNTVTVLGVILAIFVLYFVYTMRVKSAVNPIAVPYANEKILAETKITESMISTRLVPPSMIEGDVVLNISDIVGKYVNPDTVIPKGSLFYSRSIIESENLEHGSLVPDNQAEQLISIPVSILSTYGNSMVPKNYVDIWITAYSDSKKKKVIVGKLFSNARIRAVQDDRGNNVFQNMDEERVPKTIIFSMPIEYAELLSAAMQLSNVSIKLVPTHESLQDNPGEISIGSKELKDWISKNIH
jgi:Flp pilus assembly protein CpaB